MSDTKINRQITAKEVRVIDDEGSQLGIFSAYDAQSMARDRGLDLIEVASNSNPPVCKISDYGKYMYEKSKKEKEQARKNRQNRVETKEIYFRPVTDTHDVDIKTKKIQKFIDNGNKVKIAVKFRGREISHIDKGREIINGVLDSLDCTVVNPVKLVGNNLVAIVSSP